jgi:hypothetical protein
MCGRGTPAFQERTLEALQWHLATHDDEMICEKKKVCSDVYRHDMGYGTM